MHVRFEKPGLRVGVEGGEVPAEVASGGVVQRMEQFVDDAPGFHDGAGALADVLLLHVASRHNHGVDGRPVKDLDLFERVVAQDGNLLVVLVWIGHW